MRQSYSVLHLFCGIGGAALGMQSAETEYRGIKADFITLGGIDCDPDACKDFEMFTGAPAFCMDLFSREDYTAFHGQEPPDGWEEVTLSATLIKKAGHRSGKNMNTHWLCFMKLPIGRE